MTDSIIIWCLGIGLVAAATMPAVMKLRAAERKSDQAEREAHAYGLKQPASLHPAIDPDLCIGIGNCVKACPEADIIGLRDGRAFVAKPALCVGHGACERACPVQAITLVFGTAERGVELPRLSEHYETTIPGIFVVGELGGMGLIRNAFEQGRQCVEEIARRTRSERRGRPAVPDDPWSADPGETGDPRLDLVVVGCGPAGLAASLYAHEHGLSCVTLEREDIGGAIRHYPRKKIIMTEPIAVPGAGQIGGAQMTKEDLVGAWSRVVRETGLEVRTRSTVQAITHTDDGAFAVRSSDGEFHARRVILAIGRRGVPKTLGIPGEELGKVAYSLREPRAYRGDRILVVGGGDSAVEAATALAEEVDTKVVLSYRRAAFTRIRPLNRTKLERAVSEGRLTVLFESRLLRVESAEVHLEVSGSGRVDLANDQVFIFIGGELPTPFLKSLGVLVETKYGRR